MERGWTKRSYDALFRYAGGGAKKAEAIETMLLDGLDNEVSILANAENMGVWYRMTITASDAVGCNVVKQSANEAESELTAMAATLGRKGGSVKSERKAAASRENGKKGGRPRKGE